MVRGYAGAVLAAVLVVVGVACTEGHGDASDDGGRRAVTDSGHTATPPDAAAKADAATAPVPLGDRCATDKDCTPPARCLHGDNGGSLTCRCEYSIQVFPFDGGPSRVECSTCGPCGEGFSCCGYRCLNLGNDPRNCGACGHVCEGAHPFCDNGRCSNPPCHLDADAGPSCDDASQCCGAQCCGADQQCCYVPGAAGGSTGCYPAGAGCPMGCPMCICAAPDTPIAAPGGERAIAEIAVGDLVYSIDGDAIVVVPVVRVRRRVAPAGHQMVRVTLASGAVVEMSPSHPTADGGAFADLAPGDPLGEAEVLSAERVPYGHAFTYDILPASSTGTYFASGALVGSTLRSCP